MQLFNSHHICPYNEKIIPMPLTNNVKALKGFFNGNLVYCEIYYCVVLCVMQVYHKFDITITMKSLGLGKSVEVKPLNEDKAVDLAAEMLGELFVFAVGVGILISEYLRQQRKDQAKEDVQNRRLQGLESSIRELELSVETQSAMLREITRAFAAADMKMPSTPASDLPKKITDPSSKTVLKVSNVTPAAT